MLLQIRKKTIYLNKSFYFLFLKSFYKINLSNILIFIKHKIKIKIIEDNLFSSDIKKEKSSPFAYFKNQSSNYQHFVANFKKISSMQVSSPTQVRFPRL